MDTTTRADAEQPRLEDLVRLKRDEILEIARRHGAGNVRVFGSVARGESGPDRVWNVVEAYLDPLDRVARQELRDLDQRQGQERGGGDR